MSARLPALLAAIFAGYRRSRLISARRVSRCQLAAIE
jgi:hypothetical protein